MEIIGREQAGSEIGSCSFCNPVSEHPDMQLFVFSLFTSAKCLDSQVLIYFHLQCYLRTFLIWEKHYHSKEHFNSCPFGASYLIAYIKLGLFLLMYITVHWSTLSFICHFIATSTALKKEHLTFTLLFIPLKMYSASLSVNSFPLHHHHSTSSSITPLWKKFAHNILSYFSN